jgi:hypothetical protein
MRLMGKARAATGSLVFLVVAPPYWLPLWIGGLILVAAGVLVLVQAFARFVAEGLGTPAPVAPTERLVVGGLYRYVRNPMYPAVAAIILGQALALGQLILLPYAAAFAVAGASFVRWYEEPTLRRQFRRAIRDVSPCRPGLVAAPRALGRGRHRPLLTRSAQALSSGEPAVGLAEVALGKRRRRIFARVR